MSETTSAPRGGVPADDQPRRSMRRRAAIIFIFLAAAAIATVWYVLNLSLFTAVSMLAGLGVVIFGWFVGYRNLIMTCIKTLGIGFDFALWSWPIILLGVTWFVPALHRHIQFPMQEDVKDWFIVFALLGALLAVVSAVSSFVMIREEMIIINLLTSIFWLVVITFLLATVRARSGGTEFWTIIAFAASAIEVIAGSVGSVHNAWNKNPTQVQSGGGGRMTL